MQRLSADAETLFVRLANCLARAPTVAPAISTPPTKPPPPPPLPPPKPPATLRPRPKSSPVGAAAAAPGIGNMAVEATRAAIRRKMRQLAELRALRDDHELMTYLRDHEYNSYNAAMANYGRRLG